MLQFFWLVLITGKVVHRLMEIAHDADGEQLLADTLHSVFSRVQIPHAPNQALQLDGFFADIIKAGQAIDPQAQILVGGGTIRSFLGWLCEELLPVENVRSHLQSLIKDSSPLEAIKIMGIGSDIDFYYEASRKELSQKLADALLHQANSASLHLGIKHHDLQTGRSKAIFNTLIPMADISELDKRFEVYVQGGSTLDMIYFDLIKGRFLLPPNRPHLLRDFLHGHFEFAATELTETVRLIEASGHEYNPHKNCIRGLRPLLEIPSIDYDQVSRSRILKELKALRLHLKTNPARDSVIRQMDKMLRNSRLAGAGNLIWSQDDPIWIEARAIMKQLEPNRNLPRYSPPTAAGGHVESLSYFIQLESMEDLLLVPRNGFPLQAGGFLRLNKAMPAEGIWIPAQINIPSHARVIRWRGRIPFFAWSLSWVFRLFGIDGIVSDAEMMLLNDFIRKPDTPLRYMESCEFSLTNMKLGHDESLLLQAFSILSKLFRGEIESTRTSSSPYSLPTLLLRRAVNFVYLPWLLIKN